MAAVGHGKGRGGVQSKDVILFKQCILLPLAYAGVESPGACPLPPHFFLKPTIKMVQSGTDLDMSRIDR